MVRAVPCASAGRKQAGVSRHRETLQAHGRELTVRALPTGSLFCFSSKGTWPNSFVDDQSTYKVETFKPEILDHNLPGVVNHLLSWTHPSLSPYHEGTRTKIPTKEPCELGQQKLTP